MKTIDEHYKDWFGESHLSTSNVPTHDSAEACDFAKYYFDKMNDWISVEEELPEKSDNIVVSGFYSFTENPVIVKTVNGKYSIAKRNLFHGNKNSKWEWMGSSSFSDSITHWRQIELK